MSTDTLALDGDNHCTVRENPWDTLAFGFPVTEITDLTMRSGTLLERVDERNAALRARLCVCRVPAGDRALKGRFLAASYYVSETSLLLQRGLHRWRPQTAFRVRRADMQDVPALSELAAQVFRFSRYHEDPHVDEGAAAGRYRNWVSGLGKSAALWVVYNASQPLAGFFSFQQAGGAMSLNLAGIHPAVRGLGFYVFAGILTYMREFGDAVTARVSAANIDMLNVYSALGFMVESTALDYHKLYAQGDG